MAARTRTLQQLLDGVADRGDFTIAASGRHTTTTVTARINRSIQRWLLMVCEAGDDTNLKTVRTATTVSTVRDTSNWAPNQYVAQPAGLLHIRGIDVWSNNTPIPMAPADESERDDAQLAAIWLGSVTGMPVFYRIGGTNQAGANLIQIFPWADAVYTVDIRYIPAHVDLTTPATDTIDFIAGGEEWVINDVVLQSKITDGLDASMLVGWNAKIEKELFFMLACRGHSRREDTVGRREMLKRMAVGGWRIPG